MKRSHRLRVPAIAVVATAALAVAACSSSSSTSSSPGPSSSPGSSSSTSGSSSAALTASAPGITATTITIGSHQPLTGPAAPGYSEIAPASAAYFAYVNANGGVDGRTITYKYLDDAYNPTQTATRGAPARPAGQRVRDLRRARHPHPPGGGELPQRAEGPRRVRRVRVRLLEPADGGPGDVRLAARLHPRGEDPRAVRGQALRRQEDRLLLPGRRVRHGRRQGARRRDPEVDGGRQADATSPPTSTSRRRSPPCARPALRSSSRSPFPRSPRC